MLNCFAISSSYISFGNYRKLHENCKERFSKDNPLEKVSLSDELPNLTKTYTLGTPSSGLPPSLNRILLHNKISSRDVLMKVKATELKNERFYAVKHLIVATFRSKAKWPLMIGWTVGL